MPASARATCAARLAQVARGLGLGGRADEFVEAFQVMTRSWGTASAAELAESDVSSDGSPMEVALGLDDGGAAVQFAVEPIGPHDTPQDRVVAARATMGELTRRYGVPDQRWNRVAELFLPDQPAVPHVVMYGAEVHDGQPVQFKVWFYPAVAGRERAVEACKEGLSRLGLTATWPAVLAHMRRDHRRDRPVMLSLDLSDAADARVKLYFRHYQADIDFLAGLMGAYPGYAGPQVRDFCTVLTCGASSLAGQPPVTCLTFTTRDPARVASATLYLPMWIGAPHDEAVRDRVDRVLAGSGRSAAAYQRALRDIASRPLRAGRGIHNYVAWRPGRGQPRIKVYLSPELRHIDPVMRYRVDTYN